MDSQQLFDASSFIIPLVIAITLHEAAHGFAAFMLGDPTAKQQGRMSLDPFRHIDPLGTLLLPGLLILTGAPVLFGWAKPVPVNFGRLRKPRLGMMLVALAGPGMNLLLAFISALLMHLDNFGVAEKAPWAYANIVNSVMVNVVLAVFNLLPILPLDGGRVLNALLPRHLAALHARTERYGMAILLIAFLLAGAANFPLAQYAIGIPADYMRDAVLRLAGIGNG